MRVLLGVGMGEHLVVDGGSVVLNHCARLGKTHLVLGLLARQQSQLLLQNLLPELHKTALDLLPPGNHVRKVPHPFEILPNGNELLHLVLLSVLPSQGIQHLVLPLGRQ